MNTKKIFLGSAVMIGVFFANAAGFADSSHLWNAHEITLASDAQDAGDVEYCPPPKLGYQFTGATFYSPYNEVSCFYVDQATGQYPYANHIYGVFEPIWPSAPDECFSDDVMQCPFEMPSKLRDIKN